MKKPHLRIVTKTPYEHDLQERLVRTLQDSRLHVVGAGVLCGIPVELGGDPDDLSSAMLVTLTMLTDGRRGWLVLVDEAPELDMAVLITELLDEVVGGLAGLPAYVVREATSWNPPQRERTLDLREPGHVPEVVEAAFEAAFADRPDADVAALLPPLEANRFGIHDELTLRRMLSENDPPELATA